MAFLASPALAQAPAGKPGPVTKVIATADTTRSGQPVILPQGPVRVTLSDTVIPVGGGLPAHKHLYPRYGYILSGRMQVKDLDTGQTFDLKAGDMVLDPVNEWHETTVLGDEPLHMMTFDQAPPGAVVTVRREP